MQAATHRSLAEAGAVLLVSCYELGHQPLGLAMAAGFLERAGYRPALLDVAVEPVADEALRAARFVGISVPMHTALRIGRRITRRLRQINPSCHICFYGLYAPLHEQHLYGEGADSVLGGECEADLVRLVQSLEGASAGVPERKVGARLEKLDFAVPSRARLPELRRYAHLEIGEEHRIVGYVEASRGCLHHCRHCPIPAVYGGRIFVVPQDVVLADVRAQVEAGATHITFGDADFLNGPVHSLRVVRAVHADMPNVTFDFTAKVEHLLRHRDLLPELRSLGGLFAVTAVESLSDTVLEHLHKGHTRADVFEVFALARRAGLTLRPSLLPFTPWSTRADYVDLLDWAEREQLIDCIDPVQFAIRLLVPPGSLLLDSAAMRPHLGDLDTESLAFAWVHPDPEMDALQIEVARLVENDAAREADAHDTFGRIRALTSGDDSAVVAAVAAQDAHRAAAHLERRRRSRTPRLTEPWFC